MSSRKQSRCGRHGLSNILKLQVTFLYSIYHQRAGKTNLFHDDDGEDDDDDEMSVSQEDRRNVNPCYTVCPFNVTYGVAGGGGCYSCCHLADSRRPHDLGGHALQDVRSENLGGTIIDIEYLSHTISVTLAPSDI